jgi:hypothetical protein
LCQLCHFLSDTGNVTQRCCRQFAITAGSAVKAGSGIAITAGLEASWSTFQRSGTIVAIPRTNYVVATEGTVTR